ncbi:cation diffusion facilitator family transporter [Treponema sp. HNW]|uniref:cation diffusion facilitator family transporter n=1 Tax=Treponema sp. HNW TaxID=3116654 RepID=UPI003D0B8871
MPNVLNRSEPLAETKRLKLIRLAGIIALAGNLLLCSAKLCVGFISGSLAVLADGLDSAGDVAIACMTLIISVVISRPCDKDHPWGHGRAETTATMALSFIIFFAGSQLSISAAKTLYRIFFFGYETPIPALPAVIVTCVSIAGKIALSYSQRIIGKKADSAIISANAQNMLSDVIISSSVLFGIGCAVFFKQPVLDPLVAFLVGLWIIKNAVFLFKEINIELMDGNTDEELYRKLFEAIRSVDGVTNPHRARIRKIASCWDIDLDIEVPPDMSVREAHEKAEAVSAAVKKNIPGIYDIVIHVEPAGLICEYEEEGFGLCEADVYRKKY